MSFLDNLENNLKSLESAGQGREDAAREQKARTNARAEAQAAAPHAEALKKGPFAAGLMNQATRIGFSMRTKVHMAWLGSTLRLEARERRLELRPTAAGVVAVFIQDGKETDSQPVDLAGSPEALVRRWLR
ncbi:MAG TPA: hypothetical protein VMH28_23625 [Candidatus Acidoferrales bacterium]|nr:hypothetical protein [Candidatus Acidoferrales bacterium]